jgi:hypothetical protein
LDAQSTEQSSERSESVDPPGSAPWTRDFADAHRRAVEAGKPIFVYSTKTY